MCKLLSCLCVDLLSFFAVIVISWFYCFCNKPLFVVCSASQHIWKVNKTGILYEDKLFSLMLLLFKITS